MSKIICDICGTKYPDTAEQCPICGCSRDSGDSLLADELVEEEVTAAPTRRSKGGRFAAGNGRKPSKFSRRQEEEEEDEDDEDEIEEEDDEEEDLYDSDYDDDDEDDEDDEDDHKSNTPLVIILVIVILALLTTTGYIFFKFFLPNMGGGETTPTTVPVATTTAPVETTVPAVPCESLVMTSGGSVELSEVGQNWLINVMALPENTTDKITYTSSDESVATVNESGKITAVGEGMAVITISCGEESLICNVSCMIGGAVETTAPAATEAPVETTAPVETEAPTEATEPTEPLKDIKLKVLKYTDLTFNGPNQGFTFVLDGLTNQEVKWTSNDTNIVTVDENGTVISVGKGNTTIICQYGDQKVEIKITCRW